jgi:hypothetical protein
MIEKGLKVGSLVRSTRGGQFNEPATITEMLAFGWVMLSRADAAGMKWTSSCHVRDLELVREDPIDGR